MPIAPNPARLVAGADEFHHGDTEATEERYFSLAGRPRVKHGAGSVQGKGHPHSAECVSKTGRQCSTLYHTSARRAEIFCPIGTCPPSAALQALAGGSPDRAKKELSLRSPCLCGEGKAKYIALLSTLYSWYSGLSIFGNIHSVVT